MSCHHKFATHLNLKHLDFAPTTLIVGTFNPEWPESNTASWFYGRTEKNFFWDVLPKIYGENSLLSATNSDWKAFCKRKTIAITDLITSVKDADENNHVHLKSIKGYSDNAIAKKFSEHILTNVASLLQQHPTIQNIYFTRSANDTFWKKIWQPIKDYASLNNLHLDCLMTPSRYAFYQYGKHKKLNIETKITSLEDFILMKWQEKWHNLPQ